MKRTGTRWARLVVFLGLLLAAVAAWLLWRGPTSSTGAEASSSLSGVTAPSPVSRRHAFAAAQTAPGSIAGLVTDATGAPIPGALVCAGVASGAMGMSEREPTCAIAAPDGRYRLSPLRAARWALFASAQGHLPRAYVSPDHARALNLDSGEARTGVDFTLPAGGIEMRGQVRDIGGGSIAGAIVSFSPFMGEPGADVAAARSDDHGLFVVWLAADSYFAHAHADGYAAQTQDVRAPGPPIEIVMTPGAVLVGRVVEAGTGEPVAGATVEPGVASMMGGFVPSGSVSSDDEGRFRLAGLVPGRYKPSAHAPGGYGQARESVLLGVGSTSSEVVIEIHPARNVTGRVLMTPDQKPCPGGFVGLIDEKSLSFRDASIATDGRARFEGVLPGSYGVLVACADRMGEHDFPRVVLGDADRDDLVWTIQTGLTLRGRVVDRERQPVRATVMARVVGGAMRMGGSAAPSEDDGRFVLRGLLPGKYEIMANDPNHIRGEPVPVEILDEHTPELTLVVDSGSAIEGTITDQHQRPVAGADIVVMSEAQRGFGSQRSLADGSFVIKGLKPGDYRVQASKEGVPLRTPGQASVRPTAPQVGVKGVAAAPVLVDPTGVRVSVKAGAIARVQIVVEDQDGEIHGRVIDDSGAPVTDAFVHPQRESADAPPSSGPMMATAVGPGGLSSTPVLTDPEGEFTVKNLGQGMYTLRALRNGGGEATAEHVGIGQTVTLTIRRTGTLSGTLSVRDGAPLAQFRISASKEGIPVRGESFIHTGGAWTLGDLPEGKYQIDVVAPEGTASAEVSLASGEQRRDVVLTLVARGTIKGRVVSLEEGTPLAGVNLHAGGSMPVVTDGSGSFQLDQVESGKVDLLIMPPHLAPGDGGRDVAFIRVDIQPGAVLDLGSIPLAKLRLTPPALPGDLGFSVQQPSPAEPFPVSPLQVTSVRPGGPAEAAGLRVGDAIVSVDGHDVTGTRVYLYRTLSTVPPGTTVTLGLARGGRLSLVAANPSPDQPPPPVFGPPGR